MSIERAVVILNEHSSNVRRMQKEIGALPVRHEVIFTDIEPARTFDSVSKIAAEGDVILGAGGDGTAHSIINMMLSRDGQEAGLAELPFVPLRGGNANDIAVGLNGRATAKHILQNGQTVVVKPLQVSINDEAPRYTAGYMSIGGTAAASLAIEHTKTSATRFSKISGVQFGREAIAAWLSTADQPPFAYTSAYSGETAQITDALFMRGRLMAKIGHPHADLLNDVFESVYMKSDGRIHTLKHMFALQMGKLEGVTSVYERGRYMSADGGALPMQLDGEVVALPSGSEVTAAITQESLKTLTVRSI